VEDAPGDVQPLAHPARQSLDLLSSLLRQPDLLQPEADSLVRFGGLLSALLGAGGWKLSDSASAGPAGVASGALSCVLTPEQTEGPYYIPNERVRRDITEGKPGTPLRLHLTVANASSCKSLKDASVDTWHAAASGVYSCSLYTSYAADDRLCAALRGCRISNTKHFHSF